MGRRRRRLESPGRVQLFPVALPGQYGTLASNIELLCLGVLLVNTNISSAILKFREGAESFFKDAGSPRKTVGYQMDPAKARQAQGYLARGTTIPGDLGRSPAHTPHFLLY